MKKVPGSDWDTCGEDHGGPGIGGRLSKVASSLPLGRSWRGRAESRTWGPGRRKGPEVGGVPGSWGRSPGSGPPTTGDWRAVTLSQCSEGLVPQLACSLF